MKYVKEEFERAFVMKKIQKFREQVKNQQTYDYVKQEWFGRMSKRDLVKRLYTFFLRCLRLIRAYNMDDELVEQIKVY